MSLRAGLILMATTITVSVTIKLFSILAGSLFIVSGLMLALYLPAATHLKKLRMGAAGEPRFPICLVCLRLPTSALGLGLGSTTCLQQATFLVHETR